MPRTDICIQVVTAIAAADDVEIEAVSPLFDYIDPDILEKLTEQSTEGACRVEFQFEDHYVSVTHDSQIYVDGTQHASRQFQE